LQSIGDDIIFIPPPNFDKWFEFAKENDVQLIDEYDGIYDSLLPFGAFRREPSGSEQRTH